MSTVLFELNKLQLDSLSDGWVESIYFTEFLEFGDIPPEYEIVLESLQIPELLQDIIDAFNNWLYDDESPEDKSWSFLSQQIQHRKLLALIAYFIDRGAKNVFVEEHRNNALLSSQLYYKLLAVSGYKAYHVYHSQLFAQSLVCLNFPKILCENEEKYFNARELPYEVNKLIKSLRKFVRNLRKIIENLQLSPTDMNFEDILANLLEITGGAIVNKLNIDKIELTNVTKVIYEMIDILVCDADKKPSTAALQLLFKCLLPKLVAASVDVRNANNVVKASYVTYTGLLLTKYGKDALCGFNILLQHLTYSMDGLERVEVRNSRVTLVLGLMTMLPRKSHRKFVKWIIKLSTTSRITHRLIALEMLNKLLSHDPDVGNVKQGLLRELMAKPEGSRETPVSMSGISTEDESSQEPPGAIDNVDEETGGLFRGRCHTVSHAELLRAVYDRVNDVSSALRVRALSVLADCVNSSHQPVIDAIEELNGAGEVTRLMAVSARCVCDERAVVRRAAVSLLQRLLSNANATRILNEASGHNTPSSNGTAPNIDEANNKNLNDSAIADMSYSKSMVEEEPSTSNKGIVEGEPSTSNKSNVEGESSTSIDNKSNDLEPNSHNTDDEISDITNTTDRPLGPSDYAMLVGLCRDASIVVRVGAITALGELATQWPGPATLDAFLTGPMHQLSDPETRVQELVVTQVQELLINRIKKYQFGINDLSTLLPWLFLEGIVRHNMRRHLLKACSLLYKSSNGINHRLVDIVSTHLGVLNQERDLQCLVLLTSVARHVEYSDLTFLLEYYYKIDDDMQRETSLGVKNFDGRILALTLELCTIWSRWASVEQRTTLRERLVTRLADNTDYGCRTACASLAAHLEPNNLQWATELMQISERRALEGGAVEEWVRAADLSLVAPALPAPGLLALYLAALADPPAEWSAERRGACVAGAGRLCVRSRGAAAALAPPLAALLRDPGAPLAARLNALRALADICIRYTCIVEPLLEDVCACLGGGAPAALRRGAVRAVTRLLLGGYLRLRTPLYYKYCALLADEDQDVREPAEYYVTCCLTVDAIFHHLVDCVVYYNSDQCVSGAPLPFDARQLIYDVMLQRLSLVQRLNAQCRFAREVLARAADEADEGELPAATRRALLDTIAVLCGPRMRLPRKPQNNGAEADLEDLQERVTTNIVSHKMKRTVAEVVVPAVLRLYGRLRAGGGQLAAYLVRLATDLLADYRAEIEELIDNDEELVQRVRQFHETIGLEPAAGNARNLVTTSAPPEPDTPRAPRKRPPRAAHAPSPRKRVLRV